MSADACTAAMARGAATRPSIAVALRSAAIFGLIEVLTPILGWVAGMAASAYVAAVDRWIAFAFLGGVGGKMVLAIVALLSGRYLGWVWLDPAVAIVGDRELVMDSHAPDRGSPA